MLPYDRQVMLHDNIIIHILHVEIVNSHLNITVKGRGEGVCHLKDDTCNLICATFSLSFFSRKVHRWPTEKMEKLQLSKSKPDNMAIFIFMSDVSHTGNTLYGDNIFIICLL